MLVGNFFYVVVWGFKCRWTQASSWNISRGFIKEGLPRKHTTRGKGSRKSCYRGWQHRWTSVYRFFNFPKSR